MPKRVLNLRLHITVDHDESAIIKDRMKELDCCNRGAFLRKMAIDRYAANVDITPAKELISLQRRCVNNLSQIASHAQAHNAFQAEIIELQKGYAELCTVFNTLKIPCETCCAVSVCGNFGPTWPEVAGFGAAGQ